MKNQTQLSIALPSYQEAENLEVLLPRLHKAMDNLEHNYEILIIDTMTPLDNTKKVCESHNATYLNRENGNTFGDAVRTAINAATGKYILFMDADGSHPPEFIPKLYQHREAYDVAIASRYVEGGHTENNVALILMSRILNIVYSLVLNIRCKDVSNSLKLYDAKMLKKIKLNMNNFDIVEEILFKLNKNNRNLKMIEVPFSFKKRMFGKTKRNLLAFIVTYMFTLLRLRFGK